MSGFPQLRAFYMDYFRHTRMVVITLLWKNFLQCHKPASTRGFTVLY